MSVEEAANFSGCTYALEDAGVGACQRSGQAPHYWRCRRSDGSEVDSATYCGRSNPTSETCSYPWTYSAAYGGWSECTSGAQTRAIASCTREDGTSVPTSLCTAAGIAAEQSQSCTSALARWDAFKGVCDGEIASYTISDARKGMPDAVAYKQACAERGGACFMHQMSETHDYDGRQESYQESYSCGTNAISKPEAVGSWSNANGSGFVYTEVKL